MKYERRVMTYGPWRSFKELEDCLTMPELTELYDDIMEMEYERNKTFAAIMGAEVEDEEVDREAWSRVQENIRKRAGGQKESTSKFGGTHGYQTVG